MNKHNTATDTDWDLAEEAARRVNITHGITPEDDLETQIQALAWNLGEGPSYEAGMTELVAQAVRIHNEQNTIR